PYITDKARNAKMPKDKEPKSLTLEECQALLAAAPERGKWGRKGGKGSRFAPKTAPNAAAKGAKGGKGAPTAAPEAAASAPVRVKLAAKGKKTAVNKQAPVKPAAAAKAKPTAAKAKAKAKKSPAKKKT
ncbi:MAG TPA: topoisomerase C-terminal repeat-containing protein, partial [Steroidobacteraceae bacterium]|nr:topoisomerase C-terminal repeat-containing protein [Steroidobacteraceae bacterium]